MNALMIGGIAVAGAGVLFILLSIPFWGRNKRLVNTCTSEADGIVTGYSCKNGDSVVPVVEFQVDGKKYKAYRHIKFVYSTKTIPKKFSDFIGENDTFYIDEKDNFHGWYHGGIKNLYAMGREKWPEGSTLKVLYNPQKPKQAFVEKVVTKEVIVEKPADIFLKVNDIEPNREQPRKTFDQESLQELADSISQYGVIEPLVVRKMEGYYEIIAGERRWRAAKLAGVKEVPVFIRDYSDQEAAEVALIENLQRENLDPIEEAMGYQKLIEEFSLKQDDVARKVSKSRVAITNSLRLLKLDERVRDLLIARKLTGGQARPLLSIADGETQFKLATRIVEEGLTAREIEALVKNLDVKPAVAKAKHIPSDDYIYRDYENRLKDIVGTKVVIHNKDNNKGKVEIEYYNRDDFERIVEMFQLLKKK